MNTTHNHSFTLYFKIKDGGRPPCSMFKLELSDWS